MKTCCRCKIDKALNCFTKYSNSLDGINGHCKECQRLRAKKGQRYIVKIYGPEETKKCITCHTIFVGVEANNNFHTTKIRKDGLGPYCKNCRYIHNKEYINIPEVRARHNKYKAKYMKNRKHTDPDFYFQSRTRSTVTNMLRVLDLRKKYKTEEYVGCDAIELQLYLKNEYFNRTGSYPNPNVNYELDHIRPISDFKNEPKEEREKASMYYNLRYLTKKENREKWYHFRPEDKIIYLERRAVYDLLQKGAV